MKKLLNLTRLTTLTSALAVSGFALVGCEGEADAPDLNEEVSLDGVEVPEADLDMPETGLPEVGADAMEALPDESEAPQAPEEAPGY